MNKPFGVRRAFVFEPGPIHLVILAAIAAFFYLFLQASNFVLLPRITIASAELETKLVQEPDIEIRGSVRGGTDLEINGNKVRLDNRGDFVFQLSLARGLNLIDFSSKNRLGRERNITREIVYEPE